MSTPAPTSNPTAAVELARPSPLVDRVYGEPRLHTEADVAALAFAADGTLYSVDEAGVLRHWAADGRQLSRAYLSDLETLWAFAPGAAALASGNDDLLFWDVPTGSLRTRLAQPTWVTALGFSADGRVLASGHDDGSVRFWDVTTHRLLAEIEAHAGPVSAVAFAPDGGRLATAGEDRAVRVWDAATKVKQADLLSHTDRVPALAWRPDGGLLVSAGWDTSARVWDPTKADPLILLNSHSDQVLAAAFAPTGRVLATADSDHDIHLWADPTAGTVARVLRGHADEIRALAFSADGSRLASGGADRVIHLWDAATGALVAGPTPAGRHGVAVVPSADGLKVAGTGGPTFRLWDADTGAEAAPSGDGPAHAVAASADGRWLAVGGTDHFTRLYDLHAPGTPPKMLEATKPPIGSVAVGNGVVVHTSPADGLVWIWNPEAGTPELILIEAADGCTLEGLAALPDGRLAVGGIDYLSTGERTGAVCVWDWKTKEKQQVFDTGVYALAGDPKGRYLAGAGTDNAVYLWDLERDEEVFALAGHTDRVNAVAFSPDGSYLVSGGDDLTVRVWDVLSGRLLVARAFDAPVQGLAFAPDGTSLFLGNADTTVYRVAVKALLEE